MFKPNDWLYTNRTSCTFQVQVHSNKVAILLHVGKGMLSTALWPRAPFSRELG
jgi:hypothetical protein